MGRRTQLRYWAGLISLLLLAFAAAANAQDSSSPSAALLSKVKVIDSKGGSIESAGRVRVVFPPNFFLKPETVNVLISGNPTTDNALAAYELHGAGRGPYLAFDVLVEADQEPQDDYEMTITFLNECGADLRYDVCGRIDLF